MASTDYGPLGPTNFELREEAGADPWWYGADDSLVIESRVPRHPAWRVEARFSMGGHDLVLERVTIEPASNYPPSAPGLTSEILRAVRTISLYKMASGALELDQHEVVRKAAGASSAAEEFRAVPRPGQRGRNHRYYAEVVAKLASHMRKNPTSPRKSLAKELFLSPSQLSNILTEARRRKILGGTKRGKAGGTLTDYGRRLLESNLSSSPTEAKEK